MWPIAGIRRVLIPAAVLLGVALRLVATFVLRLPPFTYDSTAWYMPQAEAIRDGHWLNTVPNGYPLLLALLPGRIATPLFVTEAQLVNIAAAAVAIWLGARAGRAAGVGDWGCAALALFIAGWHHQVNYARYVLTEAPTAALLVLATWAALTERPLVSGLAGGALGVMRTTLLPLALLWPLAGLAFRGRRFAARQAVGHALVILGVVISAAVTSGHAGLGSNLAVNINIATTASHGVLHFNEPWTTVADASRRYATHAIQHPGEYLVQRLEALNELWGPYPLDPSRGVLYRVLIGLRFPLVIAAAWALWRRRLEPRAWIVAVPVILVTVVHTLLFATARFSMPAEPLVLLLVAMHWCAADPVREAAGQPSGSLRATIPTV